MRERRRCHNEEGSILIIALAFLAVAGLAIAGILSQAQAHLIHTEVTRAHESGTYAGDAGVEWAVQQLRQHPSLCQSPGSPTDITAAYGPFSSNNQTLTVTCQTTAGGGSPGARPHYAIMTTQDPSLTGSFQSQSGTADPIQILGPVFISGKLVQANNGCNPAYSGSGDPGTTNLQKCVQVKNGNVAQRAMSCNGLTQDPNLVILNDPSTNFGWKCPIAPPDDPNYALPPPPTTVITSGNRAAGFTDVATPSGTCRVVFPGTFSGSGALPFSLPSEPAVNDYYFASGVYYFNNVGNISIPTGMHVFGGNPTATDAKVAPPPGQTDVSPCATDAMAAGHASGQGVELVFGGNSSLTVNNNTRVEFFRRYAAGVSVPDVSIYGVRADSGSYLRSTADPLVNVTSGGAGFSSHGVIYAWNSGVDLFGSGGTGAQALFGIIAKTVSLQASNAVDPNAFVVRAPAPDLSRMPRTITVVATATWPGATPQTTGSSKVEAVVWIDTDDTTAQVKSWRSVGVP